MRLIHRHIQLQFCFYLTVFIIYFFNVQKTAAQIDAHYWTHQYGAEGLLLNGAMIAAAEGETAIFYNPGSVGLAEDIGFELSFITPTFSSLKNTNLIGDNKVLIDKGLDYSPGFLGVTYRPFKKAKNLTIGYTSFERSKTDIALGDRSVGRVSDAGNLIYRADLSFKRRIRDYWMGPSLAYNITDNLGIGFTQFVTFHRQSTELDFKKEILQGDNPAEVVQSWRYEFGYGFRILYSFITKFGLAYRNDSFKLGLTYTSPGFGGLRTAGSYQLEDFRYNDFADEGLSISNRKSVPTVVHKSPQSFGLGLDVHLDYSSISFSMEYFNEIPRYINLQDTDDPYDGLAPNGTSTSIEITEGNESVLNFAVGYQVDYSDDFTYIIAFRTDFDQSNSLSLNDSAEYLGSVGNVFHLSGGGMFRWGKNEVSGGIDIGYGRKSGGNQLVDLSSITPSNIYSLSDKKNVENRFFSIMVFFTYDFIFKRFR